MHNHSHSAHGQHHSRRDFFQKLVGGAMAGASVLEMGFFRAAVARAQAPAASTNLFDIQKIGDGVYFALAHPQALTNCNAAIFVNAQDVLVVDAHSKPSAAASLIAQIKKEVTPKPVRYLVNTHFHWDHTQGDAAYKATGNKVEIIASETTKQLLAQNSRDRLKESLDGVPKIIDGLQARLAKASSAAQKDFFKEQIRLAQAYQVEMKSFTPELPDITFAKEHVVKDKAHDLHIQFHGRAHTAGDVAVFCPQQRVVATGDAIIGFLPNIADGYPREWPRTINTIEELAADKILPGHGTVQTGYDRATQMRNYIEELNGLVEAGKKAGKSLPELQKTITLSSLKTLQANGYGAFVADTTQKYSVYLGSRTALEDRLAANVDATYKNLDRA
ncbi:MAG TPA: MBL fold metallo-hydrolase [Bryobacteraceae bacterium]|jgi:glyoxylase-like metal-dependent hydrolase (beta-lactamase superfamily II)|nr:MBL fold metallo-hydrolase [Bryobacteraceae bacterium]